MPSGVREPRWLSRVVIDAIHIDQIREHGGLAGIREEHALARLQQKWHYGGVRSVPALAAAYGFGLVTSHPYRDGNKRIGFLAMATFPGLNRQELTATEADVVTTILSLASGTLTEAGLEA